MCEQDKMRCDGGLFVWLGSSSESLGMAHQSVEAIRNSGGRSRFPFIALCHSLSARSELEVWKAVSQDV